MKVFGFAGWSGSGKTTLIEQLIPRLARNGPVSLVKHAHHEFDIDQAGKDSWRHRQAGCTEVLVSSSQRFALMHELRGAAELTLPQALARLSADALVLVEGYKAFPIPKLEVWRAAVGKPLLHLADPAIRGIATDTPEKFAAAGLPVFPIADVDEIATFVLREAAPWSRAIDAPKGSE
ncbi:MAG: molybdopterin-guanine dinucleotide biosynthesis protein B [Casimicrobiaceae bacterium]